MKKSLTIFLLLVFAFNATAIALGGSLPLTEAEIQKLQRYFPVEATDKNETNTIHHLWKGDPLIIELPLDHEKRLVFSEPVTAELQGVLNNDQLRLLNNHQSLYFTALKRFPKTRINVTLQNSHQIVFIDLLTADKASQLTEYVDLANTGNETISSHLISAPANEDDPSQADSEIYVTLLRNAWQQLYAPDRLLTQKLQLIRVPMHADFFTPYLIYGDKEYAHPLISWQYKNLTITAIELRNKYTLPTEIDVDRDLCGQWLTATLYPSALLKPAGNINGDSTTLFVISSQPFGTSVEQCHA